MGFTNLQEYEDFFNQKVVVKGHLFRRYLRFCWRMKIRCGGGEHLHHILPKSLFPEFKDLRDNPWNGVRLSFRHHFVAHIFLSRIFRETHHMGTALFLMAHSDNGDTLNSREYAVAMQLYSQSRKEFRHTEESKLLISCKTKEAFDNPLIKARHLKRLLEGISRRDCTNISRTATQRMTFRNPMKDEHQRERMRGDNNIAKRPEIAGKISEVLKAKEVRPWEHHRATSESLHIWSLSQEIYQWGHSQENFPTCSEIRKMFKIRNGTSLFNLRNKIVGGWVPSQDSRWVNFFSKQ